MYKKKDITDLVALYSLGLDIANIRNGYVYHTRNDLPHNVEQGSMQRGGK